MKRWKRWIALSVCGALCVMLLSGCGGETADGMALSVSVGADLGTLDPIYAEEVGDQTIVTHLYENLMRVTVDATGKPTVSNGMAKSVSQETNYDGTVTYTFKLRGAKWSDGRAVRAEDFVYAWQRLADPASQSPYAELLSVVAGYEEARAASDMGLMQVSAKNDSTLVVVLNGNYDWFLTQVCTSPATMPLREDVVQALKGESDPGAAWWSDPAALVTNGPYEVTDYERGEALYMAAGERYYGTQPGPEMLMFHFTQTAEERWKLYKDKAVDAVWPLPLEELEKRAADKNWSGTPELATYSALFNCDVLQDPLVREALTLVIDRSALAEAAGPAVRPAEGLVPPGVPENEETDFRGAGDPVLVNDPETNRENRVRARELLAQAGYDSGASLGELEYLYVEEGSHAAVAQMLCEIWQETLQIHITPRGVTEKELWAALRAGEYSIAGVEVKAVGNDAECFLMQWTSDSPDNVTGYSNSAYDTLMSIIASASDGIARMGCLHDAEELLLTDGTVVPLFTRETIWELRDSLTGACRDARGWFVFSGVVERMS